MIDTFGLAELTVELTVDEGKRGRPYKDTVGKISIGIGRNLTDVGLSDDEIATLFSNDVDRAAEELDANAIWWRDLAPNEQRVMLNLTFNMGWGKLAGFVHFLSYMQTVATLRASRASDDAVRAALTNAVTELKASLWWSQVGLRGPRIVSRLLPGNVSV